MLDGRAFVYSIKSRYVSSDGRAEVLEVEIKKVTSYVFKFTDFPELEIFTSPPDAEGGITLTEMSYVSSNYHGWIQSKTNLLGAGQIKKQGDILTVSIDSPIEQLDLTQGAIKNNDKVIKGSEALTQARNRQTRIAVLGKWMRENEYAANAPPLGAPQGASKGKSKTTPKKDTEAFQKYWERILIPETVKKDLRPKKFDYPDDAYKLAGGIKWNTGYTARLFQNEQDAELGKLRDSGTILRDITEAVDWIQLEFFWDALPFIMSGERKVETKQKFLGIF
jgi:hypothetical protein